MEIAELLALTKKEHASDLHLTVGVPPVLRVNGELQKTNLDPLDKKKLHDMLYEILTEDQKSRFEADHELDFSVELENVARFRVNAYLTRSGVGAAFRMIDDHIPSIEELNLPKVIERFSKLERGLVLVTGPTGSGKSTTLAALINLINQERRCHIITLEDPIEYVHKHQNSIINQREVGSHTHSFANALRSALREDPDVILVGEMRDLETIQLAIRAAETGHLVFSTLHTASSGKTIDRIIDVFPADRQEQIRVQLSDIIEGILAQTLIPTVTGTGRVAAVEVMFANSAIRNLIRENKAFQIPTTIQLSTQEGMQSMDQALVMLTRQGLIAQEAAEQKAYDRENYRHLMLGKMPQMASK
ncbi:MAG TPA: type IV pilus twitching motility protein PilT [bacterium]|nr:type IV pilus twitching motility protein PilT [bacterium]